MTQEAREMQALYESANDDARLIIEYAIKFMVDGSEAAKQAFSGIEKRIADPAFSIRQIAQYVRRAAPTLEHVNQ